FSEGQGCLGACQGDGGPPPPDGGPPPPDGGPPQDCQGCATQKCQAAAFACATDQQTGCGQWLQCIGNCQTTQCSFDCDNQFAAAASKYQAVYACTCMNCSTE